MPHLSPTCWTRSVHFSRQARTAKLEARSQKQGEKLSRKAPKVETTKRSAQALTPAVNHQSASTQTQLGNATVRFSVIDSALLLWWMAPSDSCFPAAREDCASQCKPETQSSHSQTENKLPAGNSYSKLSLFLNLCAKKSN